MNKLKNRVLGDSGEFLNPENVNKAFDVENLGKRVEALEKKESGAEILEIKKELAELGAKFAKLVEYVETLKTAPVKKVKSGK